MSATVENCKELSTIYLEGSIGIADARELKTLLLEALKSKDVMRVSLERVTDLDVTAVQLLWAARREARSACVVFAFTGVVPERVTTALADAGFDMFLISDK